MTPMRIVVLGSGEGTNFEALATAAGRNYEIVAVGSDRSEARILERARRRGISAFSVVPGDFPTRAAHDQALRDELAGREAGCVALAGYMRLVGPQVLEAWRGRMLNVHPALLPAFPGLHTHERALAAGTREHGATVHFVTAKLDAGPRIVQGRLRVHPGETAAELADRVQKLEHRIYPAAVDWFATGRVSMKNGRAWLDGRPLAEPVVFEE